MDVREQFEKTLVETVMTATEIRTVVVLRPEDGEEVVYRNGVVAEVVDAGGAMAMEESFVQCVPREDENWDCVELIWSAAERGPVPGPGSELEVLGEYVERRHFLIGPSADAPVQQ